MEHGIAAAHANGGQRLGPEITNLEDEWHTLAASQPPTREPNQQLRRRGNHDVGLVQEDAGGGGRNAKRAVVQHALVRFAIGEGKKPGTDDVHSFDVLAGYETAKLTAIFGRHDSGGMIGESG